MKSVQFGREPSEAGDKSGFVEVGEIMPGLQLGENLVSVRLDIISIGKWDGTIGLRDVDGADFASKIINLAKQIGMKAQKVVKIENGGRSLVEDIKGFSGSELVFPLLELRRVGEAKFIRQTITTLDKIPGVHARISFDDVYRAGGQA